MLCEECKLNEASYTISVMVGGEVTTRHLCGDCMAKMNMNIASGNVRGLLSSLLSAITGAQEKEEKKDEVQQPEKWCGQNLLGEVLMQVREDLRRWKEAANGDIHYEDATDAEACGVWKLPIPELLKMPEYRDALDIYFEITLYRLQGDRFFIDNCTASPEELEFIIAGESGGGLPGAWFFEMKQDMYDIMRFSV